MPVIYRVIMPFHMITLLFPFFFLTEAISLDEEYDNVRVISSDMLSKGILSTCISTDKPCIDPVAWLKADYAPLPSFISAARRIFNHQALPQIRRALSAGIPQTIDALNRIASHAQEHQERHLAFVTGVPEAGKTLVGIQFVYENTLIDSEINKK